MELEGNLGMRAATLLGGLALALLVSTVVGNLVGMLLGMRWWWGLAAGAVGLLFTVTFFWMPPVLLLGTFMGPVLSLHIGRPRGSAERQAWVAFGICVALAVVAFISGLALLNR